MVCNSKETDLQRLGRKVLSDYHINGTERIIM